MSRKTVAKMADITMELGLTNQTDVCQQSGLVNNRDLNAAQNFHRANLVRIHACGNAGSQRVLYSAPA